MQFLQGEEEVLMKQASGIPLVLQQLYPPLLLSLPPCFWADPSFPWTNTFCLSPDVTAILADPPGLWIDLPGLWTDPPGLSKDPPCFLADGICCG